MSFLFEHVISPADGAADGEPRVRIVGTPLEHPRAGSCVRITLEGLTARGQQDVAVVVRAAELDALVTDALKLLSTVAEHAKGQPLDVGDVLTLRNRAVFGSFKGAAFARSAHVPGALLAIPLTEAELEVAELAGAPRVLAHLASSMRAWPCLEEVVRDRPACITPSALKQSGLTQGMPRAGLCAASVLGGRAMVTLGKRASTELLETLRGGRPFLCGAPLDDTSADAVLVSRPGGQPAVVFAPKGAEQASLRVAANSCAITLTAGDTMEGDTYRGAAVVEDAIAVVLAPPDAKRLCGALETGTAFLLDDPADGRLKLTIRPADGPVTSARARVDHVFLTALELMSEPETLSDVDLEALAQFHDGIVLVVDAAVRAHRPAPGTELRLRYRAEPGRDAPRVSVLKTHATSQDLVDAIGDAVCAKKAPAVPAPIAFEVVLAVL